MPCQSPVHANCVPLWTARRIRLVPFLQGDAFKTLFVSRISFETTEKKLKREFEEYGPIKRLRMVQDATGILLWPNVSLYCSV